MANVRRGGDALVCDPDRMNIERMAAAGFVAAGGVFWAIAAFSGAYVFRGIGLTEALGSALVPLALTVIVFGVGWFSEILATGVLFSLSAAGLVWGVVVGWDPVMWLLMLTFFIAPMVTAGVLYLAAWRMEVACGGAERALRLLAYSETSSLQ